jgi:hypothetical protein
MTPRENRIAAIVLAMLLPSLGAVFWSTRLATEVPRPGSVRTFTMGGTDHAAFAFDGALHVMDANGRRIARQPFAELTLIEEPTDMDWTVSADGAVQAWFFEDSTPRVVRCDWQAAQAKLQRCEPALSGAQLKMQSRSYAVHFAVDATRKRIFIADAKGHTVRAFTPDGRQIGESRTGELFFPNRLRIAGDQLIVADNDHRRLVWLDIAQDTPSLQASRQLSLARHPEGRGRKAADFAFLPGADGEPARLWALGVEQGQKHGRVLVYGARLEPRVAADLGGHGDPLIIDRLGESLLVADFAGIALYRVGADGSYLGMFGDIAMRGELDAARTRLVHAGWWKYAGWAGLAASLVIGFLLAMRYSESPGKQAADEAFGGLAEIEPAYAVRPIELKPAEWHRRQLMLVALAPVLLMFAFIAAVAVIAPYEISPAIMKSRKMWAVTAGLFLILAVCIAGVWTTWQVGQRRLWLGQGRILVRLGSETIAQTRPEQLLASPQALLIGNLVLPYRGIGLGRKPGRWIYDEEKLSRFVLAHLSPQQRLPHPALVRATLRGVPLWRKVLIGAPLAAYAIYLLWQLAR